MSGTAKISTRYDLKALSPRPLVSPRILVRNSSTICSASFGSMPSHLHAVPMSFKMITLSPCRDAKSPYSGVFWNDLPATMADFPAASLLPFVLYMALTSLTAAFQMEDLSDTN